MNKKIFVFIFCIFILSLFFCILISAVGGPDSGIPPSVNPGGGNINPDTGMPKEAEKVNEIGSKVTDDNRTEYLKQEWEKILSKTEFFGPIIAWYKRNMTGVDLIFKLVLGIPLTISWLFVLTIVLWIAFLVYSYRISAMFEITSKLWHLGAVFIVIALISWARIPLGLANNIIGVIALAKVWWGQLIIVSATVLVLVLLSVLSKNLENLVYGVKKQHEDTQVEMDKKKLHDAAQTAGEVKKAIVNPDK